MGQAKRKQQAEEQQIADCSDFVECLDHLITAIYQREIYDWRSEADKLHIEMIKRAMKDFLRRNSAAKGLYVDEPPSPVHHYATKRNGPGGT